MEEKQEKKRKLSMGRLKLLILVGVAIYAGITLVSQQSALSSQIQKQETLLETEAQLVRDLEYYENTLSYIGTDEYVEKQARERFGWLEDDEIKFVEAQNGEQVTDVDLDSLIPDEAVVTSTIMGEQEEEEQPAEEQPASEE
jgi:cell division protein FtsB